jgi:hypothetical protein
MFAGSYRVKRSISGRFVNLKGFAKPDENIKKP